MSSNKNLYIVDRSHLAINFYFVLFKDFNYTLVKLSDIDSLVERIKRREKADLIIVSSNVFKDSKAHIDLEVFKKNVKLANINKLFLCSEGSPDHEWSKLLKGVPNSKILQRPFHPPEMLKVTKKLLGDK
ncbi:MAG: hypothetical protein ABIE74_07375 [Pseudomonadota bacterium]